MSLVQKLFDAPLDIVGDVHGEIEALQSLLTHLGYDSKGNHAQGRKLVFVGDLVDRGPNSPAVVLLVKDMVDNGNAQVVLGNHELNILQGKPKDGTGWFIDEQSSRDEIYQPFVQAQQSSKKTILEFLAQQPVALENEELRIVHAAWIDQSIEQAKSIALGSVAQAYDELEREIDLYIAKSGLLQAYEQLHLKWQHKLSDEGCLVPFLQTICDYNLAHQTSNPLRALTSGVERKCEKPFYASGKWRFVERFNWWDEYEGATPVIVGHFWRSINSQPSAGSDIFKGIDPLAWHGKKANVFCVDFSVGARFKERNAGCQGAWNTTLAALRWPEASLMLETGQVLHTTGLHQCASLKRRHP